jgi:hypothetical protein
MGDPAKVQELVQKRLMHHHHQARKSHRAQSAGLAACNKHFADGGSIAEAVDTAKVACLAAEGSPRDAELAAEKGLAAVTLCINTVAYCAADKGQLEELVEALERGADVDWANPNATDSAPAGRTPLLAACASGKFACAQKLLECEADPLAVDEDRAGALYLIAGFGEKAAVAFGRALMDGGADVNAACSNGSTPLIRASCFEQKEFASLLLDGGADPDLANMDGVTALICAVMNGQWYCSTTLVQAGAALGKVDKRGRTALGWAQEKEKEDIEQVG